jgi:hypothetical protein
MTLDSMGSSQAHEREDQPVIFTGSLIGALPGLAIHSERALRTHVLLLRCRCAAERFSAGLAANAAADAAAAVCDQQDGAQGHHTVAPGAEGHQAEAQPRPAVGAVPAALEKLLYTHCCCLRKAEAAILPRVEVCREAACEVCTNSGLASCSSLLYRACCCLRTAEAAVAMQTDAALHSVTD